MKRDYYEILGLTHKATDLDIKSAYRKLALEYHPDRNPEKEAEERFKEASEAYEVLSDPERRALYDTYGHSGLESHGFHGFTDVGDIFSHFSDIFEEFFGRGGFPAGRGSRTAHGRDLRYDLQVSFMEAYGGGEKSIQIHRQEPCHSCGGQGYPKGSEPVVCQYCGGSGQLYHSQGFFTISSACQACRGQGHLVKEHCPECRGHGVVEKPKKLSIKIPPGVDNGTQMCLRGEGEGGRRGGRPGDLYVVLHVTEHALFKRHGDDLFMEKHLTMLEAALGEEVEVETPEEKAKLRIPKGSQTGDLLKLKGKGMPHLREKKHGDLLVQLFVETPKNLSERQEELLRTLFEDSQKKTAKPALESSFTKSDKHSKKNKRKSWF